MQQRLQQAKIIRAFRWLHRKIAVASFVFFFIIALTGLLLGVKKNTGLLAPTQKGSSQDTRQWLSVDSLHRLAVNYLHDSVDNTLPVALSRIDIRPDNGIAKFIFKKHYHGLQLDCATGQLLSIEIRRSDFIERIHDGSIIDDLLGTGHEQIKVSYTILMGSSLLILVISGFWLWYGPKRLRKLKQI